MAPNTMIRPCIVVNWLKNSGLDNLQARLEQLGADGQRHHAPCQEHDEAEPQIHGADIFVVGGHQPAHHAAGMMVVRVCDVVIVYCCHGFLLDAIF